MGFCEILLAIILPPAAVLARGGGCCAIFINIILTLCGWIPGVIHALFYCCAPRRQ